MKPSLEPNDVARFLAQHPDFFYQYPDLLTSLQLSTPLGGKTVSLQQRQMEVLREKIKVLELRLADLLRMAQENDAISSKFQDWTRSLLLARNDIDLPHILIGTLQSAFDVPYATLRCWNVNESATHTWFAREVSADIKLFSNSLSRPFCGLNHDFEVASWLEDAPVLKSLAMLPLRVGAAPEAFGLLVLGSADPQRFAANLATDFLMKISQTSSAALSCLLD